MKIRIRESDRLYSLWLRKYRGYKCEKCLRIFPEGHGLQVSHFWGRRYESVRFDEENTDILCFKCHQHFEETPPDYVEWKEQRMGTKAYNLLKFRAHQLGKRDDVLMTMFYKKKLKELSTSL